ncbi:MAG: ribosomal-protein-alanine N-acetyltransferase [Jatrophihabitans sp.]|nr:MAG: ribosomal-protein-alanine N-acetyltransferase [Jatrophihabitans sp.]
MTVSIVAMTAAHVDALMPHEREMFGTEAWSANAYRQEIADTELRHYVAAVDGAGAMLGWAGVMVIGETAQILTVGTVPQYRRRGVARTLVADLLQHARDRRASEVFLEVRVDNDAARALYAAAGFTEIAVRKGYYDRGRVDAVVMRRDV